MNGHVGNGRRTFIKNTAAAMGALVASQHPAAALTGALGDYVPPASESDGFKSIFDGKTLNGWSRHLRDKKKPSLGLWAVQEGMIIGGQEAPGLGAYLVSDEAFADFELEIEAKTDWPTDTGVYVRTNPEGNTGFQVGLDYRPHGAIGGYFGNGIGGFHACNYCFTGKFDSQGTLIGLVPEKPSEPLDATRHIALDYAPPAERFLSNWSLHGWNRFRIRSVGEVPHLTTWINGMKVAELDTAKMKFPGFDPKTFLPIIGRAGHISLEVHNIAPVDWLGNDRWAPGAVCRWRNIRVKTLQA